MKYLQALQAVARGYRGTTRHVQIRKDRSVGLYKSLRVDPKKHDCLGERLRRIEKLVLADLKANVVNKDLIAKCLTYRNEYNNRLAGNPTEGFEV